MRRILPDDYSMSEQAKLFTNVKLIIAPHGVSLTNVVFSNWDNLVLIEITELNNLDIKDIYFDKRLPSGVINLENNDNSGLSDYDTNHDDISCNSNGNDEYEDDKKVRGFMETK